MINEEFSYMHFNFLKFLSSDYGFVIPGYPAGKIGSGNR
jgi:hypothetical protein